MKLLLPSIDTDLLPGLFELDGGLEPRARQALEAVIRNLADTSTPPGVKRKLKIKFVATPDADLQSGVVRLESCSTTLAGLHPPPAARVIMDLDSGVLSARTRIPAQEAPVQDAPQRVLQMPGLNELFDGELERTFQRELARLLLNLRDPSVPRKAKRELLVELVFVTDDERDQVRLKSTVKATLPPTESPKDSELWLDRQGSVVTVHRSAASVMPRETVTEEHEADAVVGRQARVLDINRSAS